ncbi:MAG: AmiS/UreI family transporter [Actinomycetes bacterium]
MNAVGLLYVGAVLFINGLMLLGKVPGKSAAVMNIFVGIMQVVFPTIILAQSGGDTSIVLGASGLYLFGFTYLYVGLNQIFDLPGQGLGWFSIFVAFAAAGFGILQFTQVNDPVFGIIWFQWAVLWTLFFLLLGLGKESLTVFTGWFTVFTAHITCSIPAFLLLSGHYSTGSAEALGVAVLGVLAVVAAYVLSRRNSAFQLTAKTQSRPA